jgi:hypothetical protein
MAALGQLGDSDTTFLTSSPAVGTVMYCYCEEPPIRTTAQHSTAQATVIPITVLVEPARRPSVHLPEILRSAFHSILPGCSYGPEHLFSLTIITALGWKREDMQGTDADSTDGQCSEVGVMLQIQPVGTVTGRV